MAKKKCVSCDGDGWITVNDTNPYGFGPDPQWDRNVECPICYGDGEVECADWELEEEEDAR